MSVSDSMYGQKLLDLDTVLMLARYQIRRTTRDTLHTADCPKRDNFNGFSYISVTVVRSHTGCQILTGAR